MPMQRAWKMRLAGAGIFFLCAVLAVPAQAQDQQRGLGERLGEQLDQGIGRLTEEVREGWSSLRQAVNRMGVQGRVYSRLRWDKDIATMDFEVDVEEEGVVTLRGELDSAQAKRKAVELAEDTVGVQRVIDDLSVRPAAEEAAEDAAP